MGIDGGSVFGLRPGEVLQCEHAGEGLQDHFMKNFGEGILRGKMAFTTSQEEGTMFKFILPREQ